MNLLLLVSICCLVIQTSLGADAPFSYHDQAAWTGVCNSGNMGRQAPINIVIRDVVPRSDLTAVQLSDTWNMATAQGRFSNTGHNVQFDPDADSPVVTTQFPIGNYQFLQMHMHWGNRTGIGSEHLFDGGSTELEIHFVHTRITTEGSTSGNRLGVIGIFAEVSESMPISGFWETLDARMVPNSEDNITISNFTLSDILPPNLNLTDYYHYEGGLTTPPCTESVQFFLFRQRISVPAAYLQALRSIRDTQGNVLDFNNRDPQALNNRTVFTPGSSATVTTVFTPGSSATVTKSSLAAVAMTAIFLIAVLF